MPNFSLLIHNLLLYIIRLLLKNSLAIFMIILDMSGLNPPNSSCLYATARGLSENHTPQPRLIPLKLVHNNPRPEPKILALRSLPSLQICWNYVA